MSKAQENVINDIVDICNKYRKKNQDKDMRKSIKEIEFIKDAFTEVKKKYPQKYLYQKTIHKNIQSNRFHTRKNQIENNYLWRQLKKVSIP